MQEESPPLSGCGNLEVPRMCPTCRFSWTPHSLRRNQPFLENSWEINGDSAGAREGMQGRPLGWPASCNSPGPSVALSLTQR